MWFRADDKFHDHPKVRGPNLRACGLWVLAGTWSADNLTDGFVPRSLLSRWGATARDAKWLVDRDLWEPAQQGIETGWLFHDWEDYNPTKAQVEAERQATRDRIRKWRERKGQEGGNP